MNERQLIYDYLSSQYRLNDFAMSLCERLDTDTLVDWFYNDYFGSDDDALIEYMGEKNGNAIIDYYKDHHAKQ